MKIYQKSDGKELEREPIDAREAVATGFYTFENPKAKAGDIPTTRFESGEILRRTKEEQDKEAARAQYQQQVEATAVADHEKMEEAHPARKAAKDADAAEEAAVLARQQAELAPKNTKLKENADVAEKTAAEQRKAADKARKDSDAADAALAKERAEEAKVNEKLEKKASKTNGDKEVSKEGKEVSSTGSIAPATPQTHKA
jgi:membrane protein involved in colicin uptake